MKTIHYCHIGMAKSGSSAMFAHLSQHPQIDYRGHKENYNFSHYDWTLTQYQEYYNQYNVSMNFSPDQWAMTGDQISELNKVITHASICLRNPWDFVSSLYTFIEEYKRQDTDKFVDMMLETNQLDYAGIIAHWLKSCNRPFLVVYYDDLVNNHTMVYNQITDFLGLSPHNIATHQQVNVTKPIKQSITYRKDQISKINTLITQSEQYLSVDLTHWKK